MPNKMTTRRKSELSLWLVAIVWGTGFVGTKFAMDAGLSPSCVLMLRFGVATLTLWIIFRKHIRATLDRIHVKSGVFVGVFLFLGFMLQTIGMKYTTPANNAFITATNVVMVPFLWWFLIKKRPGWQTFLSTFLCFVGVAILSVDFSGGFSVSPGDLLTLLSAFFYAAQIVLTGRLVLSLDATTLLFLQLGTTTVLSAVSFLLFDHDFSSLLSLSGIAAVVYMGIFCTCLCYFWQTHAQQYVPPAETSVILACESLFGTLYSILLGYDPLSVNIVLGGLIIFVAVLLPDLLTRKHPPAQEQEASAEAAGEP